MKDAYDFISRDEFIYGRKMARKRKHQFQQRRRSNKRLTPEYFEHMRSVRWKMFRMTIIAQRGKKCERCGKAGKLDLHHKHYQTFGNETPSDVELLCFDCHDLVDRQRRKGPRVGV